MSQSENEIYHNEPKQYKKYSFKEKKKFTVHSGCDSIQGGRQYQEDAIHIEMDAMKHIPLCSQKDKIDHLHYFAIFDGHNGKESSLKCSEIMHYEILEDPDFINGYFDHCLVNSYYRMDNLLCNKLVEDKSGTTSIISVIYNRFLVVSNVGDSECLLIKRRTLGSYTSNNVDVLSKKHNPKDEDEKKRVKEKGGILFNNRIYGQLAVSRSLGDKSYKGKGVVIPDPYINVYELTSDDKIIILACDGIFEKMEYDDVMEFVIERLEEGLTAEDTAKALTNVAYERGSRDNCSCIVVVLNWS